MSYEIEAVLKKVTYRIDGVSVEIQGTEGYFIQKENEFLNVWKDKGDDAIEAFLTKKENTIEIKTDGFFAFLYETLNAAISNGKRVRLEIKGKPDEVNEGLSKERECKDKRLFSVTLESIGMLA